MELDMESLSTSLPADAAEVTRSTTASGAADCPTPATASATTPARSGLSEAEQMKLARIRRNRNQGWMPTFKEFDFLLEMVERIELTKPRL
jgi:hypothetical protein